MAGKKGLWISLGGEDEAVAVERAIEDGGRFTAVVSTLLCPRKAELCLVSTTGEMIDYVGISQVGQRVATGKKRIAVTRLTSVGVSLKDLRTRMPGRFRSKIPDLMFESRRL